MEEFQEKGALKAKKDAEGLSKGEKRRYRDLKARARAARGGENNDDAEENADEGAL